MTSPFSPYVLRPSRYRLLPRPRLTAQIHDETALIVVRATEGMGKTTAARELMAMAAARGPVFESAATQVDPDHWARAIEMLVLEYPAGVTVLIDHVEAATEPAFAETVLQLLETHTGLCVIVAGSYVHGLDERAARLRVPVQLITDEMLLFTASEVTELAQLRLTDDDPESELGAELFKLTYGWPLAVHDALVTAARRQHAEVFEHHVDHFCADVLTRFLPRLSTQARSVLMLTGAVGEVTAQLVEQAFEVDTHTADALLGNLARYVLQQRIDEWGVRRFRLHEAMQRVLWRARRQLADPNEVERWAALLTQTAFEVDGDAVWVQIYAAFDASNWERLSTLLLHNFSEVLLRPNELLRAQLRTIPEAVQQRYPVLRLSKLLEEFAFPQGRRDRVLLEFREIATHTLVDESHSVGLAGVLAAGMRLGASRVSGDTVIAARMLAQLQGLLDRLPPADRQLARTMIATVCGQLAITAWYLDDFELADAWCAEGLNLCAPGLSISRMHLSSVAAVIAAWRGDMRDAERRLEQCASMGFQTRSGSDFAVVGYWIARAMVALERRNFVGARAAYDQVSWRISTNEHWPYMVWVKTLIIEGEQGGEHALVWLDAQMEAHKRGFVLMPGPKRALEDLHARLAWQQGRHQLLPPLGVTLGLAGVYAELVEGDFASAGTIAAAVAEHAARQGFWRLQIGALLLRVVAEHERADPAEPETRERVFSLLQRYGLTSSLRERAPWWNVKPTISRPTEAAPMQGVSTESTAQPVRTRTAGRVSKAELRTLRAVALEGTTPAAAKKMHLSVHTVRDHMKSVYRKLGVRSRAEALDVAISTGLIVVVQGETSAPG